MPQSATFTPFSVPVPDISHFVVLRLSPETRENLRKKSLINLFATYVFWLFEIKFGNKFLIQFDNTFEVNLTSTLNRDIGLQFFISLLPQSFFSISFITARS